MQALRDDIEGMKARFTAMEEDITLVKRASANAEAVGGTNFGKVELLKPNRFNGVRDAKEVENFLWQMEIYFDNLNKELKRQFYPENVVYEARKKLRELRQRGSIRDYVKEFTTLMLQIPNMTAEDLVFYFTDGLQSWAKQELQRRGVKTVDEAIAVAESLVDFRTSGPSESSKKKEQVVAKGGGAKRDTARPSNSRSFEKGARREDFEARKKSFVPKGGCFVCKGPHAMKDCPKMGSLSAIMECMEKCREV
uniref:Retrotransposon gag domain-containing protein n=1 Tax=Brassica oleracea var. oleracea TaxID=109376 RepID=A0A0D3C9D7_BRAOL